jgi:ribulose-5-phosphate 4-epimerase/fuculose-1-phosphate aldolase
MLLSELRASVLDHACQLLADGLGHGTQGNLSAIDRASGLIAVTPSAADYAAMAPEDIVVIDGDGALVEGRWKPTIETPLHTLLYRRRLDVGAVIHCHAPYASGFAAALRPIPLVLVEAAACVGAEVPCAPLMPSGNPEFAALMLDVIGSGVAAIMGQHGIVTCGASLGRALATAVAVEDSARAYIFARQIGVEPSPIPPDTAAALHQWWLSKYQRTAA